MNTIIYTVRWETYDSRDETVSPDHYGGVYTTDDWDDAHDFMSNHIRDDSIDYQCMCSMDEPFICLMTPYSDEF